MKERPILFNDAMVRAILDGRKTQTRRPMKGSHATDVLHAEALRIGARAAIDTMPNELRCPFGVPGDRLWVRECFATEAGIDGMSDAIVHCRADFVPRYGAWERDLAERSIFRWEGAWRPSIHMPRWASRLTLRVTDVRVERVQDITEEDAEAEGFGPYPGGGPKNDPPSFRESFLREWGSIYGSDSWTSNPWVWVVSFERETPR